MPGVSGALRALHETHIGVPGFSNGVVSGPQSGTGGVGSTMTSASDTDSYGRPKAQTESTLKDIVKPPAGGGFKGGMKASGCVSCRSSLATV